MSGTFKKIDIPGMSAADLLVADEDEDFQLKPVQLPKKNEQFSFGKGDKKDSSMSPPDKTQLQNEANSSANGKVTIPIDWDYIIDKYIKNTNTNVIETTKASGKEDDIDFDDDF